MKKMAGWLVVPVVVFLVAFQHVSGVGSSSSKNWEDLASSIDLWTYVDGNPIDGKWEIADGVIHRKARTHGIYTKKQYENFVMEFEFKLEKGGNSGVKYRMRQMGTKMLGLEFQIVDDKNYKEKLAPFHKTGSLYELVAAPGQKPYAGPTVWNKGKIVVNGSLIEHYLNGVQTVSIDQSSADWATRFAASKYSGYKGAEEFGKGKGFIYLQDHGAEVWFRNVRIKEL